MKESRSEQFSTARVELNDAVAVVTVVLLSDKVKEKVRHSAVRVLCRAVKQADAVLVAAQSRAAIEEGENA